MTWQLVYQHFLLSSPHSVVHSEVAKAGRMSAPKFWERFEMHDVAEQLAGSGHMCMVVDILFCAYRIGRCVIVRLLMKNWREELLRNGNPCKTFDRR